MIHAARRKWLKRAMSVLTMDEEKRKAYFEKFDRKDKLFEAIMIIKENLK